MKKFSIFLVLSICLLFNGCKSNDVKNVETEGVVTQTTKTEEKVFVVGFDAEYPPYGYVDESGNYVGFDLDLAEEVSKRLGWTLKKQPIDWDSKDMELNSGNIDCIWNGFTVTGRENNYTWTVPYVDNSIVFVVNNSNINTTEDLDGKIISTQAGSSALSAINEMLESDEDSIVKKFAEVEQTPDFNTSFMNLESGLVDAVAVDIGVAKYQLNKKGDSFKILDEPLTKEQYAIGFKKGNTSLKDEVENTLFDMYRDGTFDNIVNKYSDYNLPEMVCLKDYIK